MPDVTITISTPPLQVGEVFIVKYRELPSGSFSAPQNETNAPFTLVGLTAGEYELSVILDKGGVECPEVLRRFTVPEPFVCVEFTDADVVQQSNGLYNVTLVYNTVTQQAPCGWIVQIIGALNNKSIPYSTLPASPLVIPIQNEAVLVRVIANLCGGEFETCYEADLPAAPIVCTPLTVDNVEIQWLNDPNNPNRFMLLFGITQSSPPTTTALVTVTQTNTIVGGAGPAGQTSFGSFNPYLLTPTQSLFTVLIDVNPAIGGVGQYTFSWFIIDRCNVKHTGTINIDVP